MNPRGILSAFWIFLFVLPLSAQPASMPASKPTKMSPLEQQKFLQELPAKMTKDVASAKQAHYQAIEIGAPAVPGMVKVLDNLTNPNYARAWAATALANIGGEAAAAALAKAVMDPLVSLREIAIYYGLKMRNERFDNVVGDLAASGQYPETTAWAVAGYLQWRDRVPDSLMRQATGSDDWRVRSAVANAFARMPDRKALPILRKLVQDAVPSVRISAATVLRKMGDTSPETIDAIIAGLQPESEQARQELVTALMRLTGQQERKFEYRMNQSYDENLKALDAWKQWWAENRSKFATSAPASGPSTNPAATSAPSSPAGDSGS